MYSNIHISLQYITNFQPNSNIEVLTKVNSSGIVKNNKIFCKNFIIFIILMRRLFGKNTPTVFIKPTYSNTYNILRAPYKNKISKHQISLSRFFIVVKFKLKLFNNIFLKNFTNLFNIIKFLKNFYSFFETNITYQHRSIIIFFFNLDDFFILDKYS